MKKTLPIALLFLLFALPLTLADWASMPSTTSQPLYDVHFVDGYYGWAVGGPGIGMSGFPASIILKTTDGGSTWESQTSPVRAQLEGVCFANRMVGWAVGDGANVIKTTDSGATWRTQETGVSLLGRARPTFTAVACLDESVVYVAGGNGVIMKTTDGGTTWSQTNLGLDVAIESMHMADATHGWVGAVPGLWKTTDGSTWTEQTALHNETIWSIASLVDSTHAWLGSSGKVFTTTDGSTWLNHSTPLTNRGIYFVNSTTGWAAGNWAIYFTNNSGETWYEERADISFSRYILDLPVIMRAIQFHDAVGWAVGDNGTILRYGEPLIAQIAPFQQNLTIPNESSAPNGTSTGVVCPNVSLILPHCEPPAFPVPTWDPVTNCRGEYVCQNTSGTSSGPTQHGEQQGNQPGNEAQQSHQSSPFTGFQNIIQWILSLFKFKL